jgi:tetratricopeptide (TPR) repeat protein
VASVATATADAVGRPPELEELVRSVGVAGQEVEQLLASSRDLLDGDEALAYLKEESERHLQVDPHVSLRQADALLHAAEMVGRPRHRALGMLAKADALRILGRFEESVALFEEAGGAFLALDDEVGWARSHTGWVWSMHRLGRGTEALSALDRPHEILVRHQEWRRAAGLDLNAAWVCFELGRYERAIELYDRAEAAYARLGASAEIWAAYAKANRAVTLMVMGDGRGAVRLHSEVRDLFVRNGETVSVLRTDHNIAWTYAGQGHYTRALRLYVDVLAARERAGLDWDAAEAALDMVQCYLSLNREAEALELAEAALAGFERCGTPTESAKARFYSALVHARVGDVERAAVLLGEAERVFASTGLTRQLGQAILLGAELDLRRGDWSAALREARRSHSLFAERRLVVQGAEAELVQARARLALGHHRTAARLARSALETAHERDALWLVPEAHHVLGGVAIAAGQPRRALKEYEAAVAGIERLQSRLAAELGANFLEDKLQVYQDAIGCCLRLGEPSLAFGYLERAKSRALVDYLTRNPDVRPKGRQSADLELVEELARLREEHHWFYNRLHASGLTERPGYERREEEVEGLRAAVRDREKRIARLLERLALQDADGAEEWSARGGAEMAAPLALDAGTVLVEYYFGGAERGAFVVADGRVTFVPLSAGPAEVGRLLDSWQLNLDATAQAIVAGGAVEGLARNARRILGALYRVLLQPLEGHLSGRERLVVVPHGRTHAVPFHALHDGERHLIEKIEVSVCPSSSLLRLCAGRRRGGQGALVLGYSDGGRLPHVLEEARAVAALLPGESYVEEQATRAAVVSGAASYGVLHLAAHAEARLDNPSFAHLKLADGQLSTADVFNLDLRGALVTLSACETGRSVVNGGDELIGLSRGFLYAGASTLVQSLWRVEDGSTARLMERFYRALCRGVAAGAALREAQLALLAEGAHPYFWAPFQLIGDGGPL